MSTTARFYSAYAAAPISMYQAAGPNKRQFGHNTAESGLSMWSTICVNLPREAYPPQQLQQVHSEKL